MAPAREVAARAALSLATVVLAVAVAEIGLRLVEGRREGAERRDLYELRLDRPWLYGLHPGATARIGDPAVHYAVNGHGFRDRERPWPKPEGRFRIVLLGDSVAFGQGVAAEEDFASLLEARLAAEAPDAAVEVLNLGVGGYNPYTEARLLEDVGLRYEPDLVVVQFCINDLNDPTLHFDANTRLHLGAIPDEAYPDPERRGAAEPAPPGALAWCRRLRLCARLDDAILATWPEEFGWGAVQRSARAVDGKPGPEWRWLARRYGEMAEAARAANASFAILAFPYPAQLRSEGLHPVQQRLVELGAANGWPVIDPLEAFRSARAAGGERLFLDWWHPSARGHALAADVLGRGLACEGLLPAPAHRLCPSG